MPNLPMHLYIARQVADELDWGYVHDYMGSCFLGSTAPDIRAMTKGRREDTHFAPLSLETVGTGARRMFDLHPELVDGNGHSPATRAFVLGYISHLTADEVWITTMYRPHFSRDCNLAGDEVEAQIWDRALQLDLDRQVIPELHHFSCHQNGVDGGIVANGEQDVTIPFLAAATLAEWRQWVTRFMGWDFDWERLKRALNRMHRDDAAVQQCVDRFLTGMPATLEDVYAQVPREKLTAYREQAVQQSLQQVKEYLGET